MKKNKLILSGLLSGLCLFSMGSSCPGDVKQPNKADAQQASDAAPKEEAKAKESAEDETPAEVKADDKQELAGVSQELAEAQQAQKKAEEDTLADVHAAVREGKLKEAQALLGSSIIAKCCDTQTAKILPSFELYKLDDDLCAVKNVTPSMQQTILKFYNSKYPDEDFPTFEQKTYFAAYMTAPGEKDFTVHLCEVL